MRRACKNFCANGRNMAEVPEEKELIARILDGVEVQGLSREAMRGQDGLLTSAG
jgi:hypothetical protein